MEALLAMLLGCMILLGNVTAEDCQTDNRMESVQHCIAQCPFSTLEGAMNEEENQLNLWTTFHHPRKSFPQYLVISYSANVTSDDVYYNTTETYLWTSNSIYFVIPPQVFSFLSLFIGALDDAHTGETSLTLPEECGCWLNGSLYFTDKNCSVMNYIEILTDKLRDLANVSGTPVSASDYLYQSRAVRNENLHDIYQNDRSNTFFSFIFVLPILAVFAYIIIIFSQYETIEEKMNEPKQHQNFGALISLGLTIAWYITILDIFAVSWFNNDYTIAEIFSSKESTTNNGFKGLLIANLLWEFTICFLGEILLIFPQAQWKVCSENRWNQCKNKCNTDHNKYYLLHTFFWWIQSPLLLFIPPIWCLASHFGFIIIAWSSFVRRSQALTLFYIIGTTAMFLVMRQSYTIIVNYIIYGKFKTEEREDKQKEDGILTRVILPVHVIGGGLLGGVLVYLMCGLWLLPASEAIEESPVYLYNSLGLIIVVLAFLVSYKISFRETPDPIVTQQMEDQG